MKNKARELLVWILILSAFFLSSCSELEKQRGSPLSKGENSQNELRGHNPEHCLAPAKTTYEAEARSKEDQRLLRRLREIPDRSIPPLHTHEYDQYYFHLYPVIL